MTITIYRDLEQGTPEWHQARCGIVTASNVHKIVTEARLEPAKGKVRDDYMYELIAQQLTGYVEPFFMNEHMERGHHEEPIAITEYEKTKLYDVERVGFITNNAGGYILGYSPDGLVMNMGCVEVKSRLNKFQISTILSDEMPREYYLQVQTGLYVSQRDWCDFISISNRLNIFIKRVYRNDDDIAKIVTALDAFHEDMAAKKEKYGELVKAGNIIPIGDISVKETEVEEIF